MSKSEGFATADVSVGHLDDDRVRRLWRLLAPDQAAMTEAIAAHLAVMLASWGAGRRKSLEEAAPLWLVPSERSVAALVQVGLLGPDHRITAASWKRHFGPAAERKAARSEAGRQAGIASGRTRAERSLSDRQRLLNPSVRPSEPTVRPSRARARQAAPGGAAPQSLHEAMLAAGGTAAELERRRDR